MIKDLWLKDEHTHKKEVIIRIKIFMFIITLCSFNFKLTFNLRFEA